MKAYQDFGVVMRSDPFLMKRSSAREAYLSCLTRYRIVRDSKLVRSPSFLDRNNVLREQTILKDRTIKKLEYWSSLHIPIEWTEFIRIDRYPFPIIEMARKLIGQENLDTIVRDDEDPNDPIHNGILRDELKLYDQFPHLINEERKMRCTFSQCLQYDRLDVFMKLAQDMKMEDVKTIVDMFLISNPPEPPYKILIWLINKGMTDLLNYNY